MKSTRLSSAFSLVELLVVVGIIVMLLAILMPAIAAARRQARTVDTTAQLRAIASSCEGYYTIFGAYPGLFSDGDVAYSHRPSNPYGRWSLAGTQNLVLSLIGSAYAAPAAGTTTIYLSGVSAKYTAYVNPPGAALIAPGYPAVSGTATGPLDQANGGQFYPAFYAPRWGDLATTGGGFTNSDAVVLNGGAANALPTLVDRYTDPLPILYYRKTSGIDGGTGAAAAIVSNCPNPLGASIPTGSANSAYAPKAGAAFYAACNDEYTDTGAISASYGQPLISPSGASFKENPVSSWSASGSMGYPNWAYFGPGDSRNSTNCALAQFVTNPGTGQPAGGFVLIAAGPSRQYGFRGSGTSATSDNIVVVGGH